MREISVLCINGEEYEWIVKDPDPGSQQSVLLTLL